MTTLLVRTYTKKKTTKENKPKKHKGYKEYSRILFFDTETTTDQFQNVKLGAFQVRETGELLTEGLFYEPSNLTTREIKTIETYAKERGLSLYTTADFVHEVFYPQVYEQDALCVGFNLSFDLYRLAIEFPDQRKKKRDPEEKKKKIDTISAKLSPYKNLPSIIVAHKGANLTFIRFGGAFNYFKKKNKKYKQGNFLDLADLCCILLDKKRITLRRAGILFGADTIKEDAEEHGKVTPKYIDYCRRDVAATQSLYEKAIEEFKHYNVNIDLCSVHSGAAIGKASLKQLGILPHGRLRHQLPSKYHDLLMRAYFGGRCELTYRRTPARVSILDFTSMYPTQTIIMGLWNVIIAERIITKDATQWTKEFLASVSLERLQDKEVWKHFCILVKLRPNDDCLPARAVYHKKSNIPNIGINYITYNGELHYALPDVIASVIKTGRVPEILEAVEFVPEGVQETLKATEILGMHIDPRKENFIQKLIEERQRIKAQLKNETDPNKRKLLDAKQKALKILANATTYGIFVEMHRLQEHAELLNFDDDSILEAESFEEEGEYFHPLVAVMQISGARLFLMMAEQFVREHGARHYYMDTDSIAVPPHLATSLQEYFQPLNPYNIDITLLKIEKENLWFYGISSKRYCLYEYDGKTITIYETEDDRGYKLHGLGHLKDPFDRNTEEHWHKEIWYDILRLHYKLTTIENLQEKYGNLYAVASMTVSTPHLLAIFEKFNKGKPLSEQIKPGNFFMVGVKANGVKPIARFTKHSQEAPYGEFIDYESGDIIKNRPECWGTLWDIFSRYIKHPESKFDGNEAWLERKHLLITDTEKIGKEILNIDQHIIKIETPNKYLTEKQKRKRILNMTVAEAKERGVKKTTLYAIQEKIRTGESIKWHGTNTLHLLNG